MSRQIIIPQEKKHIPLRIQQEQFNGEEWMADSVKRNHFKKKCGMHPFCGVEYDLIASNPKDLKKDNKDQSLEMTFTKNTINNQTVLGNISEEALDDWIAQSVNRTISSLTNPKKKYDPELQKYIDEIRSRYISKRVKYDGNDHYFEEGVKCNKNSDVTLTYDANKLTTKQIEGESILIREESILQSNQKKRLGRYLKEDLNYVMFSQHDPKRKTKEVNQQKDNLIPQNELKSRNRNRVFSMNVQNYIRKDQGAYSIAQDELQAIQNSIQNQKTKKILLEENDYKKKAIKIVATLREDSGKTQKEKKEKPKEIIDQNEQLYLNSKKCITDASVENQRVKSIFVEKNKSRVFHSQSNCNKQLTKTEQSIQKDKKGGQSVARQLNLWHDLMDSPNEQDQLSYQVDIKTLNEQMHFEQRQDSQLITQYNSMESETKFNQVGQKCYSTQYLINDIINDLEDKDGIEKNHFKVKINLTEQSNIISQQQIQKKQSKINQIKQASLNLLNNGSDEKIAYKTQVIEFPIAFELLEQGKQSRDMNKMEFWFFQGMKDYKNSEKQKSLNCFKQALIQDPNNFESIFNISVIYQELGKFDQASRWFKLSLQFNKNIHTINFGLALCYYKMGEFSQALKLLHPIIEHNLMPNKLLMIYLRALIYKRTCNYIGAQQDYTSIAKKMKITNYQILKHFMFAVLFAQKRQMTINFDPIIFCQFESISKRIIKFDIHKQILAKNYDSQEQRWIQDPITKPQLDNIWKDLIITRILEIGFFKRLSFSIINKHLNNFSLRILDVNGICFADFDKIQIVISGNIVCYDHRKEFDKPTIIGFLEEGDIIGIPEYDNQLSDIPDVWYVAQGYCELLTIGRDYFNDLWSSQIKIEKDIIYQYLRQHKLFKGVSILTLYKLAYELITTNKFHKNIVIYNDQTYNKTYQYIQLTKNQKESEVMKMKRAINMINTKSKFIGQSKLKDIVQKHQYIIENLKFNKYKIKGIYIIKDGICELENPTGFNNMFFTAGDFIGENLLFECKGISQYGRLKAASDVVHCYLIKRKDLDKIPGNDIVQMQQNCMGRKEMENLEYIFQRHLKLKGFHQEDQDRN